MYFDHDILWKSVTSNVPQVVINRLLSLPVRMPTPHPGAFLTQTDDRTIVCITITKVFVRDHNCNTL